MINWKRVTDRDIKVEYPSCCHGRRRPRHVVAAWRVDEDEGDDDHYLAHVVAWLEGWCQETALVLVNVEMPESYEVIVSVRNRGFQQR